MGQKYKVVELTQGFVAIIDLSDWNRVRRYSWHVHKSKGSKKKIGQPYARACINGRKVYLHRFVMRAECDNHVDHINHCTLDCRKENLRIVSYEENMKNRRRIGKQKGK
jgi:hypothetical protein